MSASKVRNRIESLGPGAVFSPADFGDITAAAAARAVLSELEKQGAIRWIVDDIYDFPRQGPRFGLLSAPIEDIAAAIARRDRLVFQVSPAEAANLLGISTQVPARKIYMTNGTSRSWKIGRQELEFQNAPPSALVGAGQITGMVFQALSYVGRERVDDKVVRRISRVLGQRDGALLERQSIFAPSWMRPVVRQIVAG